VSDNQRFWVRAHTPACRSRRLSHDTKPVKHMMHTKKSRLAAAYKGLTSVGWSGSGPADRPERNPDGIQTGLSAGPLSDHPRRL